MDTNNWHKTKEIDTVLIIPTRKTHVTPIYPYSHFPPK